MWLTSVGRGGVKSHKKFPSPTQGAVTSGVGNLCKYFTALIRKGEWLRKHRLGLDRTL